MKKLEILFITLLLVGCKSSSDSNPLNMPITTPPVVEGISITDATGQELGVWGNTDGYPSECTKENNTKPGTLLPAECCVHIPYPNPTNIDAVIKYDLAKSATVTSYIVKAYAPNEDINQTILNGSYFYNSIHIIRILIVDYKKQAGFNSLHWNGADETGNPVPSGFYRVYLEINDILFWRDILVARTCDDLPPGFPIELTIFGDN